MMDGIDEILKKYLSNLKKETQGKIVWDKEETAPGDSRVKLKSVKIISENKVTASTKIDKDIVIEIDYWNYEEGAKRLISIHLINEVGVTVFAAANFEATSLEKDKWYYKPYPKGLFKTRMTIPAFFLNDGLYSISLFINRNATEGAIIKQRNLISFSVEDSLDMRTEFKGKWIGVVRPKLSWRTKKID